MIFVEFCYWSLVFIVLDNFLKCEVCVVRNRFMENVIELVRFRFCLILMNLVMY